jgi:alkylation response protein AidB-like acyl-CoA dehydrogenase
MDFRDTPEEATFRRDFAAWLEANRPADPVPADDDARDAFLAAWHRKIYEAGWFGSTFPTEYGGADRDPSFDAIFNDVLATSGAPPILPVAHLARAILFFGTDAQRSEWIQKILSTEERWCQGFSEPEAGSDLASLRTRAVEDGDDWVIDGQKVWTSHAVWADNCMVLARTDPDLPKHKGLSVFYVPIDAAGVTVRPLVQNTGEHEFAEVFFDGVRVPRAAMIGDRGQGWTMAMTAINFERGPADVGHLGRYEGEVRELLAATRNGDIDSDPVLDDELMATFVQVEVLRHHVRRSLDKRRETGPGPAGSVDKLLMVETEQMIGHLADGLIGAGLWTGQAPEWLRTYLYSRGASLMGGTDEIQRTTIAQRVLGLPR